MLYLKRNRQFCREHDSKKCRSIFGSSGTFLFDIIQVKEQKSTKKQQKIQPQIAICYCNLRRKNNFQKNEKTS